MESTAAHRVYGPEEKTNEDVKKKFWEVLSLFPASSRSLHRRVISGAIIKTTELIYLKAFFPVFFFLLIRRFHNSNSLMLPVNSIITFR